LHARHEGVTSSAPLHYGPRVLVIAATALELAPFAGYETLCCGIGPVEAAMTTARRLEQARPDGVLHVGIAGARDLEPGTLVIGEEAIYCDLLDPASSLVLAGRVAPDPSLLETAVRRLPEAHVVPIGTAARVGGAVARCEVEAMEGFAVLRAAAVAGVPALELRAVSNRFGDARSSWRVEEALAALARAVPLLLEAHGA
jgi:futalosine hydrolase